MTEPTEPPIGVSLPDFIGCWVCVSEWESAISIEISKSGTRYTVRAIDKHGGEEAEVHGVVHVVAGDMQTLAFAAYWSTDNLRNINYG